jgi:hypothetical protein
MGNPAKSPMLALEFAEGLNLFTKDEFLAFFLD